MNTKITKGQAAKGKNKQVKNIRKSKKTDSDILQHYNLLQAAIEATSDAIFIKDIDGRYLMVNSAAASIFGKFSAEIIGLDDTQLWSPEIAHTQIESDRRIICTGVAETFEEVLPVQDKQRTYTIAKSLYRDEQGNRLGVVCTARDITERKALERELAIRQARFDAFFATAPAGLLIFDEELRYMQINEALAEVNGIAIADHIGKTVGEVLPELAPAVEPMFRQILATGEPKYNIEIEGETPLQPGVQRHWMVSYFPLIGSYSTPIGLGGVVLEITSLKRAEAVLQEYQEQLEDLVAQRTALLTKANEQLQQEITSRKQAEAELQRSYNLLRSVIESTPDLVFVKDLQGRYVMLNSPVARIFGKSFEEAIGKKDDELMPLEIARQLQENDKRIITNGVAEVIEEVVLENQLTKTYLSSKSPWRDAEGNIIGLIGISRDINDRKQAEKILLRSEQAVKKQAQREALLNRLASQIRNSLNLETILQTAVEEIRNVLQIDCCTFAWYLPDANPPACEVVHEAKPPNFPSILGYYPADISSPLVRQVLEQQIMRVDDMRTIDDRVMSESYLSLGLISVLVLPIQTKMGEIGTINCNHTHLRPWSDSEVELLQAVGVQVAIAIDQAKLYQQTRTAAAIAQAQAKKQELLNQLASQIRNSLDLDTIVNTAVQEIRDLMQVDWCGFSWIRYEADPPVWDISYEAKNSSFPSQIGTFLIEESSPLVEKMLQMEILRTEDVSTLKDSITRQNLIDLGISSILSLPIRTQKGEIGVILCQYAGEGLRYWSDAEVELLQAVADQVAIAIEQARLYEETRTSAAVAQSQAQQLQQTLEELQLTQSQLIQSEKMSSLGQLVAGVAHEINNPVNFIYGNLTHVNEYAQNLLGLLQLYQQNYPNPVPAIVKEMEAIDLDFIMEDLPKILSSMRVGADRIREIVLSLRTFSRLDEADMKEVNIHEGIDSTLLILQSRLKAKPEHPAIELVKEYDNLPLVECYPGQLNQVFMNILTNAIDAIDEYNKQRYIAMCKNPKSEGTRSHNEIKNHPSNITIRTCYIKVQNSAINNLEQKITDLVRIIIADNGPGMAESVRKRLFDPFFTTKPIGKGTGLGLAISYQIIVEKHRGAISCHSVPGKGAEFVIEIPVRQP